jgi:ATP-dependent helicase HrpB
MMAQMSLPIDEIRDTLVKAAVPGCRILLKAPTGSGKSTNVPPFLTPAGAEQITLVIEPRRMAARLLATWVAKQCGSEVGQHVGYAVRFDTRYGKNTRIIYLTDGVFQRWIQDDPDLRGVSTVIFDEFHERRLAVDVALARCLNMQDSTRKDLRVVVMSATLETAGLADYLGEKTVSLATGGRTYPVQVHYRPERTGIPVRSGFSQRETPVWERIAAVAKEAMASADVGNVLVFLPGTYEIRKTCELLENASFTRGWDVFPLYSSLNPRAQELAIAPSERPKIIVSTNVAETSLTIAGVRTVIDSGLARISSFDARRGLDTLHIHKISRASAEQRAGRAGRTSPGQCYRLWSENGHAHRVAFDAPEIHRVDLAETMLLLKAAGVDDLSNFRWLDAPLEPSLQRALLLLEQLDATDANGNLTEHGRLMARMPVPPRFSRLMLAGLEQGCVAEACFIAAAVQGEMIFTGKGNVSRKDFHFPGVGTDFAAEFYALQSAQNLNFDPKACGLAGISARAARELAQGYERLLALAKKLSWPVTSLDFFGNATAIGHAMLAAFSDQLAIRLNAGTLACRVSGNRRGKLDDQSIAKNAEAFIATEMTEVEGRETTVHLRRATAIDIDWLRELFPDEIVMSDGVAYDDMRKRVVARKETKFRDLSLECKEQDQGVNLSMAAEMLAERVLSGELTLKNWDESVEQWTARLNLIARVMPELGLPGWSHEDRVAAIAQICHGSVSYKEIKEAKVWPVLHDWLNYQQHQLLEKHAPEWVKLAHDRRAKITYPAEGDPFIAVRVQHLFGIWETPRICGGKQSLLVHICAPNQRPWQMTKDLQSFWASGYTQMKKDIAGRYPKHAWPDDPRSYVSPPPKK